MAGTELTAKASPWRRVAGSQGFLLLAVTGLAVGLLGGPFVTQLLPIDPASPRVWPLVRIALACGSPLLIGLHAWATSTLRTGAALGGFFLLVGLAASHAAILDAATGARRVEGDLERLAFSRGNKNIKAEIRVRTASGEAFAIEPWGWAANELETFSSRSRCQLGDRVELVALARLDRLVALRCERPTKEGRGGS